MVSEWNVPLFYKTFTGLFCTNVRMAIFTFRILWSVTSMHLFYSTLHLMHSVYFVPPVKSAFNSKVYLITYIQPLGIMSQHFSPPYSLKATFVSQRTDSPENDSWPSSRATGLAILTYFAKTRGANCSPCSSVIIRQRRVCNLGRNWPLHRIRKCLDIQQFMNAYLTDIVEFSRL